MQAKKAGRDPAFFIASSWAKRKMGFSASDQQPLLASLPNQMRHPFASAIHTPAIAIAISTIQVSAVPQ
jgi:hypothetical protein